MISGIIIAALVIAVVLLSTRSKKVSDGRVMVNVKRVHTDARIPYKAHDGDFCFDIVAVSEEEVAPNIWKYGIGLAFEIDRSVFDGAMLDLSIDVRPRSSVWKTGMVLSNCVGTIDEIFRGEVSAVFYHVMPDMPRYRVGDRIAQIKLGISFPIMFNEVDELSVTERGEGGYGSTGK